MITTRRIYEFNEFRVDTGQFLLMKAGRTTPITPTVFKILQFLLERAGEVVGKEELMKHVWPDCYVDEGNLNRNVSTLRKALGERPCDHRCIETVPKTGYRFVAPVRVSNYQPPAGSPRRSVRRRPFPGFAGREIERALLRRAFDQAGESRGRVFCISGDAGLGKTALVDVVLQELVNDGLTFHIARARCSESLRETEPLMPWIESLSALAEEPAASEIIQQAAPAWHKHLLHNGDARPGKMKRELLDLCKQMSAVHPLVVVIDDFHWSDVDSVDMLSFLATRLESAGVLIIVCYRPADMKIKNHPFMQVRSQLLSQGACAEISLGPLSRADVDGLLAQHPSLKAPALEALGVFYAKSEGNPLFLRELIRDPTKISDSVRHLIQAKIDRLDDTHRQLLVTASVQGREFDSAVLAATMQMQPQDVEEALQELDETHEVIRKTREEQLPDGRLTVRYRFAYGIYQEACHALLTPTRKASLSASLAEAFLVHYGQ